MALATSVSYFSFVAVDFAFRLHCSFVVVNITVVMNSIVAGTNHDKNSNHWKFCYCLSKVSLAYLSSLAHTTATFALDSLP